MRAMQRRKNPINLRHLTGLWLLCTLLPLATSMAQNPLGPPVYLADLHQAGEGTTLYWKANIARPEFVELRVLDADGAEIARVKAPQNQLDVSGRKGPFRLQPLRADGTAGEETRAAHHPMPAMESISRIGIRQHEGRAVFVELASGRVFHPAGMNHVPLRHGDHAAFEAATSVGPAFYDPLEAEAVLRLLRKNGYNTVRVFLSGRAEKNPGLSGEKNTHGLYAPYLANLADYLRRAANHGIHVIFNFCDADLPINDHFRRLSGPRKGAENLFHADGITAYRQMIGSTLAYLKATNPDLLKVILGVQFNNELYAKLAGWPFNQSGPVTTANGRTYDMSDPAQRQACYEDGLAHFHQQVHTVVKAVDPQLLTCEGLFVAAAVGRDHRLGLEAFDVAKLAPGFEWEKPYGMRLPPPLRVLARSPLDFVDIHLYPNGPTPDMEREINDLLGSSLFEEGLREGLFSRKPVMLGEFGTFKHIVEKHGNEGIPGAIGRWEKIREVACGRLGFCGYLGWSLETFLQEDIYHALAFPDGFLKSFSESFKWPDDGLRFDLQPDAAAKLPIRPREVEPTGEGRGFLTSDARDDS
jgi:hypothetical protein